MLPLLAAGSTGSLAGAALALLASRHDNTSTIQKSERAALLGKLMTTLERVPDNRWEEVQVLLDDFVEELVDVLEHEQVFYDAHEELDDEPVAVALPPKVVEAAVTRQTPPPVVSQPPSLSSNPEKTTTTLPEPYIRFATMLKVGVPQGAVEAKLLSEGLDPAVLFPPTVSPTTASTTQQQSKQPTSTAASETSSLPEAYVRFATMLKVGVPRGAVETKLISEGLDPAVLFPSSSPSSQQQPPADQSPTTSSGNVPLVIRKPSNDTKPPTTSNNKPQQRMILRVTTISSERLTRSMWTKPPPSMNNNNVRSQDLAQTLKRLFSTQAQHQLPPQTPSSSTRRRAISDENKLPGSHFAMSSKGNKQTPSSQQALPAMPVVQAILPARRSQNVAIGMAKFKLSAKRICSAICTMDASVFGRDDDLQLLARLLPTREEMDLFSQLVTTTTTDPSSSSSSAVVNEEDAQLGEPEKLFRILAREAPDASERVEAMCFVSRFPGVVTDLNCKIDQYLNVVTRIQSSECLSTHLRMVQVACSMLNDDAGILQSGLSLIGLADKLTQTKTPTGEVCAADVVVGLVLMSGNTAGSSVGLGQDLGGLQLESLAAHAPNIAVMKKDVTDLSRGLDRCMKLVAGVPSTSPVSIFCAEGVARTQCQSLQTKVMLLETSLNSCLEKFGEDVGVVTLASWLQAVAGFVSVMERSHKLRKLVGVMPPTTITSTNVGCGSDEFFAGKLVTNNSSSIRSSSPSVDYLRKMR